MPREPRFLTCTENASERQRDHRVGSTSVDERALAHLLSALRRRTLNGFDWLRFPNRLRVGNPPQLSLSGAVMTSASGRQLASFGRMAGDRGLKGHVGARPRVRNEANRADMGRRRARCKTKPICGRGVRC